VRRSACNPVHPTACSAMIVCSELSTWHGALMTESSIKNFTEARSAPYSDDRGTKPMPVKPTLGRFLRLCKIGLPSYHLLPVVHRLRV
jgi:hypothetical protein